MQFFRILIISSNKIFWDIFFYHLKHWHCLSLHIIYSPIIKTSWFFMYLLLVYAYPWIAWHIARLILFTIDKNISIWVNRSKLHWSFLRLLVMLILVRNEIKQCQVYIFQDTYFASFEIHQPGIKNDFEHTNHGIRVVFVF